MKRRMSSSVLQPESKSWSVVVHWMICILWDTVCVTWQEEMGGVVCEAPADHVPDHKLQEVLLSVKSFFLFNVFPNFWLGDSPPPTIVMALQPGLITRVPHTVWPTERWVTQPFTCVKTNKSNLFLNLTKQPYFSLRLTRVFFFLYNTQSDAV